MLNQKPGDIVMVEEVIDRMEQRMLKHPLDKMLCPFIVAPFEECYCASTSSLHTEFAIQYCGGNFEDCEIYRKYSKSGGVRE